MMRGPSGGWVAHVEYVEHEIDQPRRGCFSIVFEGGEGRRLRVFQILLACVDEAVEMLARQREVADRSRDRLNDGMMTNGTTREGGGDVLAPPLQADLAEHRLGDAFAHSCNLVVEGVKREQRFTAVDRGKQRRLKPVAVVAPYQRRNRRQDVSISGTSAGGWRFSIDLFHRTRDGRHGFRIAAPALPEKRAGAAYVGADIRFPPRQASPSLRHQPQQSRQGLANGEPIARGANQGEPQ